MLRYSILLAILLVFSSTPSRAEVVGGATIPRGRGKTCRDCGIAGMRAKLSSNSVSPQFTFRYVALEMYLGALMFGTSDSLWASVEKYKTYGTTMYLAEVDSYSLDISTYLIEPEIGVRIYFAPNSQATPYLDLGAFWLIPILSEHYEEKLIHFDTTGTATRVMENSTSGGPQVSTSGLYEIGMHLGFGAQYRVSLNFAVFTEFSFRALLGGADIYYDYSKHVEAMSTYDEIHNWLGGAELSAYTIKGYLGAQFYW